MTRRRKSAGGGAVTRREALQRMAAVSAGLALTDLTGRRVWAAPDDEKARPRRPARARAVIEIWMAGGPCHLDTFDPKPAAGPDYTGPLNQPIATSVDGIQIGELLPELAQQAHRYSIIRSMSHGVNGHETATYTTQTGRPAGERLVYPGFGAVISLLKGAEAGYEGQIPPYVVLTEPKGRFSETGFLGPRYRPFVTGGDPSRPRFAVEGIVAEGITDQRQETRRDLLERLDRLGQVMPSGGILEQDDTATEEAYKLILGDAGKVFDLSDEKDDLRERYGRNKFGQSCLVARRLVESGVPYVTINYKGWDTHKQHFEIMRRRLPELDQGMATLLADLADRGLLDRTIVWWGGEFGRTPRVAWDPPWNGGRGHHGACFSTVVAGGGFQGGKVVGASDDRGLKVAESPVHPRDLLASMCELLGIDPHQRMPNPRGLDVRVLDPAESGEGHGPLREIM